MVRKIVLAVMLLALCAGPATADTFNKSIDESANSADWDPAAPWKLPEGFSQEVVSNETNLNIYDGGRSDWHDMNTVNETGQEAGKFMYRTHEVRGVPEGGAVSVVNLKTGETSILAQDPSWNALDGIEWTPWGTFLFAEEVTDGRLFEVVLNPDLVTGTVYQRDQVGRLAHEGIAMDAEGNVYVVDEWRGQTVGCGFTPCGGGVYKFVPDNYGDLSSGQLFVLKIVSGDTFEGIGQAEWAGPIDPLNAREDGSLQGGQSYQRPEDLEIIGSTLYVAITEGTVTGGSQNYDGRVIAVNLNTLQVSDYVKPDVNVPVEVGVPGDAVFLTGFDNPDNLAQTPDGKLVIIEDNIPSDIWMAKGDGPVADKVFLFGSLTDPGAEGTGIYFSPLDKKTLYVNVQHSAAPDGDGTWAIRKAPGKGHSKGKGHEKGKGKGHEHHHHDD